MNRISLMCGSSKPFSSGVDDYNDKLSDHLQAKGVATAAVESDSWSVRSTARILRNIHMQKPSVILMQYPTEAFGKSLGPQTVASLQRMAPLVVTLHEFAPAHVLRKIAVIPLVLRASAVVVTNEDDGNTLRRWYPWAGEKVHMIPIASNIPEIEWAPAGGFTVVYFGQLRPNKGLEEFLRCAAEVSNAVPEIGFEIIGSPVAKFPDYGERVRKAAEDSGVELVLNASEIKVAERMARCSVAYLPFPDGATPRRGSLLAAAATGVPIVSTVGRHTPGSLKENIFPVADVAEASAIIRELYGNRVLLEDGHERSVRLGKAYNWDRVAKSYISLFGRVAGWPAGSAA